MIHVSFEVTPLTGEFDRKNIKKFVPHMLKNVILFLCMSTVFFAAYAQNRANNHWYFGAKAGIDFNTAPPQKLLDNASVAIEGTACLSDTLGQLLFYTRGDTVYNKNHLMMPNGFGLTAGFSISQPASIVQLPGTDNRYYIFSSDGEWTGAPDPFGAHKGTYSVVDMTLDGGLGDISTKNVLITDSVMECLLVVPHSDCNKYWVIYRIAATNRFESYLFDADGLHPTPVISVATAVPTLSGANTVSAMSNSPDNSMVTYLNMNDSAMYLLRFDNASGILSDFALYKTGYPYGSCFSPDGKKLYLTGAVAGPLSFINLLLQFDLSSGDPATIVASDFVVDSFPADFVNAYGNIQRGPDNVLYITRLEEDTISTISAPDEPGAACGYNAKGFDISPRTSWLGLPAIAYVNTPSEKKPDLGPDIVQCAGPVTLDPKTDAGSPHTWSNGGTDQTVTVNESGTYWVIVPVCGKTVSDTITVVFQNETVNFTMPNVITPDNDGMNDLIDMATLLGDCAEYDLKIYNRWGNVIYQDVKANPNFTGRTKGGSKLSPGVYFYVYTQGSLKRNGTITVVY